MPGNKIFHKQYLKKVHELAEKVGSSQKRIHDYKATADVNTTYTFFRKELAAREKTWTLTERRPPIKKWEIV